MKKYLPFWLMLLVSCTSNSKDHPLVIKPLYPYVYDKLIPDSGTSMRYKVKFYGVENIRNYNEDSLALDKFVIENIDKDYKTYSTYSIQFFDTFQLPAEKSKQQGKKHKIDLGYPLIAYIWTNGEFRCINYSKGETFLIYHKQGGIFYSSDSLLKPQREPNVIEAYHDSSGNH